jgi:hypothetical protein
MTQWFCNGRVWHSCDICDVDADEAFERLREAAKEAAARDANPLTAPS